MSFSSFRTPRRLMKALAALALLLLMLALHLPEFSFQGRALAQGAPLVIENLSIPGTFYSVRIPKLEITGSTLSKDDVLKLFDKASNEPLASRLAKLTFAQALAPEILIDTELGQASGRTIYKDVKVSNAVSGLIGELTSSGAALESKTVGKDGQADTRISGSIGALSIAGLDLVGIVKVFSETAGADAGPMLTLYKSYRIDGMKLSGTLPDGMIDMSSGPLEGKDFRARPSRIGLAKVSAILQETPNFADMSDEDRKVVFEAMIDFFNNFDYGVITARDFDVSMAVKPASAAGTTPNTQTEIHYAIGALDVSVPEKRFSFSNIRFEAPKEGVSFSIGNYSLNGFSLSPTMAALKVMVDKDTLSDEDFQASDPRDFLPVLGVYLMQKMEIKTNEPRQSFGIGEIRMAFADQIKGIPTNINLAINHFILGLDGDLKDQSLKDIRDAGLKTIDFSTSLALKWEDDRKTINISSLHADGAGLGSVDFSGTIGNAQQELFSASLSTAQILALALTAKNAAIEVRDTGGIDIFSSLAAKQGTSTPAEIRKGLVVELKSELKQTFGDAPAMDQVIAAVEKFLSGAKTLIIKVKSKNDLGLGFMDFVAAQKPEEVLKKVDIEASAQ